VKFRTEIRPQQSTIEGAVELGNPPGPVFDIVSRRLQLLTQYGGLYQEFGDNSPQFDILQNKDFSLVLRLRAFRRFRFSKQSSHENPQRMYQTSRPRLHCNIIQSRFQLELSECCLNAATEI